MSLMPCSMTCKQISRSSSCHVIKSKFCFFGDQEHLPHVLHHPQAANCCGCKLRKASLQQASFRRGLERLKSSSCYADALQKKGMCFEAFAEDMGMDMSSMTSFKRQNMNQMFQNFLTNASFESFIKTMPALQPQGPDQNPYAKSIEADFSSEINAALRNVNEATNKPYPGLQALEEPVSDHLPSWKVLMDCISVRRVVEHVKKIRKMIRLVAGFGCQ